MAWLLERLADHRLVYLDYQGQLSGDRGSVEQLARGEYHQLAAAAGEQCVQLTSDTLRACIRFVPCGVGQFTPFEFSHWQFLAGIAKPLEGLNCCVF